MSELIQLAEDYYLDNFKRLVANAEKQYLDLLYPNEIEWINSFHKLSEDAQKLLVRLLSRKGHLFRSDKLNYAEISDIHTASVELQVNHFISINEKLDTRHFCETLLTKPEMKSIWPQLDSKLGKEKWLNQIDDQPLPDKAFNFDWYKLLNDEFASVLTCLFFTNTYQDLSQFVLSDLGVYRFEDYLLSADTRYFDHRSDLDTCLKLAKLSEQHYQAQKPEVETLSQLAQALPDKASNPRVERQRQKFINAIARDFERHQQHSAAIELFQQSQLPPSRERQVRILVALGELDKAETLMNQMMQSPYHLEEMEVAHRLKDQIRRKQGNKIPRKPKPVFSDLHLKLDLSQTRVEEAVRAHFGDSCYYQENAFLNGLLGLVLWPAIFAPVEGAFNHPFQHHPLDLYHQEFVLRREKLIEQCFSDFSTQGWTLLKERYQTKAGLANPLVYWGVFTPEVLEQAANALTPKQLIPLFKVMLSDLRLFKTGQPDLVYFEDGQLVFFEVKGPGDKLQENQIRWFQQFMKHGIRANVCYVNH
ncbi:VRR-NUC domain-containing protein [Vibrio sp. SCSIO 43136]|uniref:VRR-NUC domain-containing protein n=1 Tax=Vibrio sp. SCSIO 43136 TaxID=2819101 RepID=UPI002075BD87|nr:VRR-NUC domain-containing protein [Vibrio sp. SCSIO 43136]USD68164.1 VRR-NUC domain-containing protein [Vibrio sp. SCSIO 43136]